MNIVDLCKQYVKFRNANNYDELMEMLSDAIVLDSERDGHFVGKTKVLQYYKNRSPCIAQSDDSVAFLPHYAGIAPYHQ